jgi:hypothetical protein
MKAQELLLVPLARMMIFILIAIPVITIKKLLVSGLSKEI